MRSEIKKTIDRHIDRHDCEKQRGKIDEVVSHIQHWHGDDLRHDIRKLHNLSCPGCLSYFLGKLGERKFLIAFSNPNVFQKPFWFLGVRPATPEEDAASVDAFILTDLGEIPVQVKHRRSSANTKKRQQLREKGILCINIGFNRLSIFLERVLPLLEQRREALKPLGEP